MVTPGYFRPMGTRLLEGRDFDERDRLGAEMVVIINERMAKRYWPGAAGNEGGSDGRPPPGMRKRE